MDERWLRWRTRRRVPASETVVTAQVTYQGLVRERLSPGFRGLGFTGSSGKYALGCDTCWVLLALQKSAYSDAAEIQFTVNLLVANKVQWASAREERVHLPERPSAGRGYGVPVAQARIGELLPDGADKWWRVHAGVDLAAVSADVLNDTEQYALPWLGARMAEQNCA
jgi:hypothetical protein